MTFSCATYPICDMLYKKTCAFIYGAEIRSLFPLSTYISIYIYILVYAKVHESRA